MTKNAKMYLRTAVIVATFAVLALALTAQAHSDGGVDEPWTQEMNQESYWEDRFDAECTKYNNHNGYIPASYDVAVSKGGQEVRVYDPAPNNAFITGPHKDNGQHRDISWVMKCKRNQVTTTSTSTTTSIPTTTSTVPESTTTTEPETTTTSQPTTTTTEPSTSTSTTTPEAPSTTVTVVTPSTTIDSTPPVTLPFTDRVETGALVVLAVALALLGWLIVHTSRDRAA